VDASATVVCGRSRKDFSFESARRLITITLNLHTPENPLMKRRAAAVLATAVLGLAAPSLVLACPGMYACIPNMCTEMERAKVRNHTGPGTANAGLAANSFNMTLMAQVPLTQMGGTSTTDGSSLHAWVDPLTRREYAVMGRTNGTAVIDVTNPTQPLYVANIPSAGSNTLWREPKVYGNHAYIGVDGGTHRLQYVDLTQVRNYSGTTMNLTNYGTYAGANVTKVHTVGLNKDSGYLYLSGTNLNSGAPHIVDIRNPGAPVPAGNVPGGTGFDGYSHEAQIVNYIGPDLAHRGKEIMISSNGKQFGTDTLSVVDVTNKTAVTRIASKTYAQAGYIHQGWFTEDQRYFFQNDELDEPNVGRTRTHLWDMQDLDNPVYRGYYQHATSSVDHNLYVKGNFLYEANYTVGVRVFKIGNLESTNPNDWITEVAAYDTYAPSDSATFNGAWNVYPYLPSGNILVSDIDGGLFVLRASLPSEGGLGDQAVKPTRFGNNGTMGALVPEPGSASFLVVAAAGLALRRRRD
jgi:choice-of-anchor B domain-containing protein